MAPEASPETHFAHLGYPSDAGPWRYRVLSEPALTAELARLSLSKITNNISCVTLQPSPNPDERSQDRYVVQQFELGPSRSWSFCAIFDGHTGHETVDYVVETLPCRIQIALSKLNDAEMDPFNVSQVLMDSISLVDDQITEELTALFPCDLSALSDTEIDTIINDQGSGGKNNIKVLRCMQGTTALVSLVDPLKKNLWVASLGDCQAVLGMKNSFGEWGVNVLSSYHNGANATEAEHIRREHPGEQECVMRKRVLGAMAVTRAIGDQLFKLPGIYTERIFQNCTPGVHLSTSLHEFLTRNLTPPYLSNTADVRHVDLTRLEGSECFLIMCSDGLVDLYVHDPNRTGAFREIARHWVEIVGSTTSARAYEHGALRLLRDALGGVDEDRVSQMLTVEATWRWMDDTTIVVQAL